MSFMIIGYIVPMESLPFPTNRNSSDDPVNQMAWLTELADEIRLPFQYAFAVRLFSYTVS